MKSMRFSLPLIAAVVVTIILSSPSAQAQTFTTLADFDGTDGTFPGFGSLAQGAHGNYYGTTTNGGRYGYGSVFQVSPEGKLSDIYSFCPVSGCADGAYPFTSVVLGRNGDLYGAASYGGNGQGTVFKMRFGGKIKILYTFCPVSGCTDGASPNGVIQASNGNLYGTASNDGANNGGTVFQITSTGTFKVLYRFCAKTNCADGSEPSSNLVQARNGNLYGTTARGGDQGWGTVFEITPAGRFKTLYSFCAQTNCADGSVPIGALIQGANGSLYGTTEVGGALGYGTVYEITVTNQLTTLHSFDFTDGSNPQSALIQANDGNFYGTTANGGVSGNGTIFEITSEGFFSSLCSFSSLSICRGSGSNPDYGLLQATGGAFIGTTNSGGTGADGTVFSFSMGLDPLVETVPTAGKPDTRVIILGNNLTGSTSVTFNGTPATFTVESDTYIMATVPTEATTGTVQVTTPTGTLKSNPVFQVLR